MVQILVIVTKNILKFFWSGVRKFFSNRHHLTLQKDWQQKNNYNPLKHRLSELGKVRSQGNFLFDFSKLDRSIRDRIIVLAGGGEQTKTKIIINKNSNNHRFLFDFEVGGETKEDGDGTVPLLSSTAFKDSIETFRVDTTFLEKRIDSRFIQSDWHAFFLNNARVQNVIKMFLNPKIDRKDNWYQSIGDSILKL